VDCQLELLPRPMNVALLAEPRALFEKRARLEIGLLRAAQEKLLRTP